MLEEGTMHSTWMQQQANENIRNARIQAEIEREVDTAFRVAKADKSILRSSFTTISSWLLKIAAMRPVKKEATVTPLES